MPFITRQTATGICSEARTGLFGLPADFGGDGKADINVYRPSAGSWHRLNSSNNSFYGAQFGAAEDKPTAGDFDGDGRADLIVWRPSNGSWYFSNSANGSFTGIQFGLSTDIPVGADYDGDGKMNVSVFRPSTGSWYRYNSGSNYPFFACQFGAAVDIPIPVY